jgi:hypothetical protein
MLLSAGARDVPPLVPGALDSAGLLAAFASDRGRLHAGSLAILVTAKLCMDTRLQATPSWPDCAFTSHADHIGQEHEKRHQWRPFQVRQARVRVQSNDQPQDTKMGASNSPLKSDYPCAD